MTTVETKGEPLWQLWAPLAVAHGAAAGAIATYGCRRWKELRACRAIAVRSVRAPVLAVAIGGVVLINLPYVSPDTPSNWRTATFLSASVVASVPISMVMFGVRQLSIGASASDGLGVVVRRLIDLRSLLHRTLTAGGGFLALTTLEVSALLRLERSAETEYGARPAEYVLIYGAVGTLLVALNYIPPWASLRDEGRRLCDDRFSLEGIDDPTALVDAAERRSKIESILLVDRPLLSTLQTDVVLFAPLLASAFAVFLPR